MKTAVYQWVRLLAAFYILFTAVLQLMPDKKYERYIRSFMGLLLIYMVCTPVLSFMQNSRDVIMDFSEHYNEEKKTLEKKETQDIQVFYIQKEFQKELSEEIKKKCEETGIKIQEVIVSIEGEQITVVLKADQVPGREEERRICNELRKDFGIEEQNIRISDQRNGETAVDRDSASGASSVSDRTSGIQKEQ